MDAYPELISPEIVSKSQKRLLRKADKDKNRTRLLEPRSPKQAELIKLLNKYPVVLAIGAAGSGKTYVSARHALQRLDAKAIDKIAITRPTIAAKRHMLGFLPGTDDMKMKPWMVPIMDAFRDGASPSQLERYFHLKEIEIIPFEHMRGRTIKDGVFMLDEAQNCTLSDLEMFLTRVGENAQVIICGDPDQTDLGEESGLAQIVQMVGDFGLNAGMIVFDENDVVRSPTAAEWVKAFRKLRKQDGKGASIPWL